MNIIIPSEILDDIIINYLSIYDNKNINSYYQKKRNQLIKKNYIIINNYIYRHIKINVHPEFYSKTFLKKYYPLIYRKAMMELTIKKIHAEPRFLVLIEILIQGIKKNGLVVSYNRYIDLVDLNTLYIVGW